MNRTAKPRSKTANTGGGTGVAALRLQAAPACVRADGSSHHLEVRDAVLLAYLAIEGPTSRAELCARLWPAAQPQRARANLRMRLMRLRRAAGAELVTATDPARLADDTSHDLEPSSDVVASIALAQAGGFAQWLDATRRARRAARIEQIAAAAERAERNHELAAALEHAQSVLALDATSEHAHRRVMRLHYLRGDSAAASAAYVLCSQVLARELGVAPAEETKALLRQIEGGVRVGEAVRGPAPVALLRPPRLIGRREPLKRLREAWLDERAFVLVGEAGIGKSRLLEEFAVAVPGAVLVCGRPGDRGIPLSTLARLVRFMGNRLPQAQHRGHAELLASLPGGSAIIDGTEQPRHISAMLATLLDTESFDGIVVDDLQWVDDATVEALCDARTLSSATRVRWGFATRTGGGEENMRRIERVQTEHAAETVVLHPLDVEMLRALIASLPLKVGDSKAAASGLFKNVGGNPLFVLEVLRQAHAADGNWQGVVVPTRIVDLMDHRLQGLSEAALMLARVAAIAGTDFSADLAEFVIGSNVLALADPWRELETAQLMHAMAITHDLALTAVLKSIPQSIAVRVHAKVASFLEGAAAEPARIARHHLAAGEDVQAAPFLADAARRAWRAGCTREAADFFFRAADIELSAGRHDVAFDILFDAGEAFTEAGAVEQLALVCESLTSLARTPAQHAKALLGEATIWLVSGGDTAGCIQRTEAAMKQAVAAGERRVEGECHAYLARICVRAGRLHEAAEHVGAAETLFRLTGPPRRLLAMQASKAVTLGMLGNCAQALELLRAVAPSTGPSLLIGFRAHESMFALMLGLHDRALAAAQYVAEMLGSVDVGDRDWPAIASRAAASLRRLGAYRAALELLDRAVARYGRGSAFVPVIDAERAAVFLELGRLDLASRAFASFEASEPARSHSPERLEPGRAALLNAAGKSSTDVLETIDPTALQHLWVACELMFERGRGQGTEKALLQAETLLARCTEFNLIGLRVPLLALTAKFSVELGALAGGASLAKQVFPILDRCIPGLLPLACSWLTQSFEACTRQDNAQRCLQIGCSWVERTAQESVPDEFRESFLDRNPVNRELLLAATRARAK